MENPDGSRPPRKELQGPRPTPLKVRKESHKIRKPPVPPPQQQPAAAVQFQQQPQQQLLPPRQPVIIYTVSPKVIHAQPSEFMNLVQRLTGSDSTASSSSHASSSTTNYSALDTSGGGAMSPAARFAATEKTRISPEGNPSCSGGDFSVAGVGEIIDGGGMVGRIGNPGILSPGPGSLPPISPNYFFSPLSDPSTLMNLYQDLNPLLQNQHGNNANTARATPFIEGSSGGNYAMPATPSANLFNSPSTIISPASLDFLNEFLNN